MAKKATNGTTKSATTKSSESNSVATKSAASTKKSASLDDVFEQLLKDIYNAEKQLVEALPEMAKAAYSDDLREAFEDHLEETKKHVKRLDRVFQRLRLTSTDGETCEAMEGLIKEGNEIIENFEESAVRDSALIIGAQKIEHYEIATYGSLCELADVLEYRKVYDLLAQTLDEEENCDQLLSEIAQDVNDEAYEEEMTKQEA
jgi:ferritin-like metal-binding protein YciE